MCLQLHATQNWAQTHVLLLPISIFLALALLHFKSTTLSTIMRRSFKTPFQIIKKRICWNYFYPISFSPHHNHNSQQSLRHPQQMLLITTARVPIPYRAFCNTNCSKLSHLSSTTPNHFYDQGLSEVSARQGKSIWRDNINLHCVASWKWIDWATRRRRMYWVVLGDWWFSLQVSFDIRIYYF